VAAISRNQQQNVGTPENFAQALQLNLRFANVLYNRSLTKWNQLHTSAEGRSGMNS
jgi:hypothetical protein